MALAEGDHDACTRAVFGGFMVMTSPKFVNVDTSRISLDSLHFCLLRRYHWDFVNIKEPFVQRMVFASRTECMECSTVWSIARLKQNIM
jgi:hypothetical protein